MEQSKHQHTYKESHHAHSCQCETQNSHSTHKHEHNHEHEHDDAKSNGDRSQRHEGHDNCCQAEVLTPADSSKSILKKIIPNGSQRSQWRIDAMDCPVEEGMIRKQLSGADYVQEVEFNLIQRTLTVIHTQGNQEKITSAIAALDMEPILLTGTEEADFLPDTGKQKRTLILAIGGLLLALSAEALHFAGYPTIYSAIPALIAVALCGLETYKKGWIAIRHGQLNINALMSIAVTGAALIGNWPEAAMVMALFTISELIEARTLDRARMAIRGLLQLAPETVTLQQPDGTWQETPSKQANIGDIVRVRPGQSIALDGVIIKGKTSINQSAVTGESLPVDKQEGDQVFAGTLNTSGEFEFRVTATTKNSTLSRIIHAIEEAQSQRAPTQRFVDQFARYYTPIVVLIAAAIAIFLPFFSNEALSSQLWFDSIYKALVILVIACPCALVISTPVTIVGALTAASKRGLLVKGGVYMENGRFLRWLALDKTGTITHGKPVLTDKIALTQLSINETWQIAASLAQRSDHPVSIAITQAAQKENIKLLDVQNFEAILGQGTRAVINGTRYHLGNLRMSEALGTATLAVKEQITQMEKKGQTIVALGSDTTVLGLFAVADTIKPSSQQAISMLHRMNVKTVMISGDNSHTVKTIAEQAGIDEAYGDQLPEDKRLIIEGKQKEMAEQGDQHGIIAMVGDGINDAPALARADIGFAMGAMGTDTAMETADIAIMDDDLRKIPEFIQLSKRTHTILVQNISLALGIKVIFLLLAVFGMATMWMAVFADVGASLLVVFNGLRMLRAAPAIANTPNYTTLQDQV